MWNETIKHAYDLPFATHRYILQDMTDLPHLRTSLFRRFVKFYSTLKNCTKLEVRNLFDIQRFDLRSSFGRNCRYLCQEFGAINVCNISREDISYAY